jgi:16S rRNA (cytosine967-C5)-methyltransferase
MTPSARLQAVLDLFTDCAGKPGPANETVAAFFRHRRYAGSKDRRAVSDRFYGILRRRARLGWWCERMGEAPMGEAPLDRSRLIADLALSDGLDGAAVEALFNGSTYSPAGLEETEKALLSALAGESLNHPDMPDNVRLEYPDWLDGDFRRAFGGDLQRQMTALGEPAPVVLRVNGLKATRQDAIAALEKDSIAAAPTRLSPFGLILDGRVNLMNAKAFRSGTVEVQDEGSQIAALLTDAKPGMSVIDYCAGAGGKTLALAAAMENRGELAALDTSPGRLAKMAPRLRRSGAEIIGARALGGPDDPWLKANEAAADRVLVDAPCSGSGVWRRGPDAKWRLQADDLVRLTGEQKEVLAAAAGLVRPGGRLIYATCSVLERENGDQADWFLETFPGFAALPAASVWAGTIGGGYPGGDGPYLRLTPAVAGTDGFFIAIFERRA